MVTMLQIAESFSPVFVPGLKHQLTPSVMNWKFRNSV